MKEVTYIKSLKEKDTARMKAAALAKLLSDLPSAVVVAHVGVAILDRVDFSTEALTALHKVVSDELWRRI